MRLIDYLFYRIYNFYKKKNHDIPRFFGAALLSLLVSLSLLSVESLWGVIVNKLMLRVENEFLNELTFLAIMIILLFLAWWRYKKDDVIVVLERQYENEETTKKRVRGWLIGSYFIFVFLIPIFVGFMRHNLEWNI